MSATEPSRTEVGTMWAPWAVLLCKFNDDDTEPKPLSFYEDLDELHTPPLDKLDGRFDGFEDVRG